MPSFSFDASKATVTFDAARRSQACSPAVWLLMTRGASSSCLAPFFVKKPIIWPLADTFLLSHTRVMPLSPSTVCMASVYFVFASKSLMLATAYM